MPKPGRAVDVDIGDGSSNFRRDVTEHKFGLTRFTSESKGEYGSSYSFGAEQAVKEGRILFAKVREARISQARDSLGATLGPEKSGGRKTDGNVGDRCQSPDLEGVGVYRSFGRSTVSIPGFESLGSLLRAITRDASSCIDQSLGSSRKRSRDSISMGCAEP